MNLEELRSVRQKERDRDSLQHLRDSFYEDATAYLDRLRSERSEAAGQANDPFSDPTVNQLTNEIETAKGVVESIWERRVGKLIDRASLAGAGMGPSDEGLTAEERDLYHDIVDAIEANRQRILDDIEGAENDIETPDRSSPEQEEEEEAEPEQASPLIEDEPDPQPPPDTAPPATSKAQNQTDDVERTTVRITKDIGSILGVDDREYDLAPEDIVTLPTANAEPLIERGAAETIEEPNS